MKLATGLIMMALIVVAGALFVAHMTTESEQNESFAQDTLFIEAKLALLTAPEVPGLTVDVEVDGDKLILDGYVASAEEKAFASSILSELEGVDEIVNNLEVREIGVDDAYKPLPSPSTPH